MLGFIVKHAGHGLGKVSAVEDGRITVSFFFPPNRLTLVPEVARLTRALLPLQTPCKTPDGLCTIQEQVPALTNSDPNIYQVEYENGLTRKLPETDIEPVKAPESAFLLEALANLELQGYGAFQKREALAEQWWHLIRTGLGVNALLSSRIDLRPHQAYVAGTVLLDRQQRYLLADEVGLGKTIEAGIVIHDLLQKKPSANILIICPDALSQQWLCELYSKFSGKVFQMLELRGRGLLATNDPVQAIAPFTAALRFSRAIGQRKWDLVVCDEAHHLLRTPRLYQTAKDLSRTAPAFLLLSAVPAQHREDEYLRLLALLEPDRYNPDDPHEKERFKALYERQVELGRKLSYISRRLADFLSGAEGPKRILPKVNELAALPVLVSDPVLASMASRLDPGQKTFSEDVASLLHYVGDRYRINRRILRNRRSQLIETQPDLQITRTLTHIPCGPDQLELDTRATVRRFLRSLKAGQLSDEVAIPLTRHLLQALVDPVCLAQLLDSAATPTPPMADLLAFDGQISYSGWPEYVSALWGGIGRQSASEELRDCIHAARKWSKTDEDPPRLKPLLDFIKPRHKRAPAYKFLVFAGFPGLAARLADSLAREFHPASVARFIWTMTSQTKEKEAHRFRRDDRCWLLVCDETGGEGRNFQFADEIIHYDLPWHVAKIEQRIGRLDRLGRKKPEVCSNVLFAPGEEEAGLLACLQHGFQIFSRSISGLEFALRDIETQLAATAVAEGIDGLQPLAAQIKQRAEAERAADDAQGVLDSASLERTAAEGFRRVQSTPERDIALERAFCDYFKFLAGDAAVRFPHAGDYAEGIVEFRPDQARDVDLNLRPGPDHRLPDHRGTFRRAIAQDDPDPEFFSVGNPLFDAVCSSLRTSVKGRAYAVECRASRPQWRGFEFAYRPVGRKTLLASYPGLVNHLDRIFAVRTEHCFIGEDLEPATDNPALLTLRKSFKLEEKDLKWWNFTLRNQRVTLLQDRYDPPGWSALVSNVEHTARVHARARLSGALAPAFEAEHARIAEQIRHSEAAKADDWQDEVAGLKQLLRAISEWDLELDIAGFLSVNGGIIQ